MPLLQPIQLLGCILNSHADFISRLHYKPRVNFVCATCSVKNGSRSGRRIVSSAFFLNFQSQGKVCAGNALFTLLTTNFLFAHTARFASKNLKNAHTDLHIDFTLQKTPAKLSVRLFLRCHH